MKRYYILAAMVLVLGLCAWANTIKTSNLERDLNECIEAKTVQQGIAKKILRLHILANSDSDRDQNIKKQVRDATGQMLAPFLANADSLAETEQIVEAHMDQIMDTAREVLEKNGVSYGAAAELVTTEFPVKSYGVYTFPAGAYRALEITLGEGGGHNWWCVLYPNMCFQGSVYEVTKEDGGEALREVLSPKEYREVFDAKKCKVRLKIVEYFR